MTPLFVAIPDSICPVCFDETSVIRFKLHENRLSQRVHSVCMDCAYLLFKHQMQHEGLSQGSLRCPECRQITYIRTCSDATHSMLILISLVSFVFFISKVFVEPKFVMLGRYLNPSSTYTQLIDLWSSSEPYSILWSQIELAIENLILNGEGYLIKNELLAFQKLTSFAEMSCLIALYLSAFIKLKLTHLTDQNFRFCHRALITTIFFFAIYNLALEKTRFSSLARAPLEFKVGIAPLIKSPLATGLGDVFAHFGVSCLTIMTSFFYAKDYKKLIVVSKNEFIRAVLDGKINFSSKSF